MARIVARSRCPPPIRLTSVLKFSSQKRLSLRISLRFDLFHDRLQTSQLFVGPAFGRIGGRHAGQHPVDLEVLRDGRRVERRNVGTAVVHHTDQPVHLQADQRLLNGGAADGQRGRNRVPVEALTGADLAPKDEVADVFGDAIAREPPEQRPGGRSEAPVRGLKVDIIHGVVRHGLRRHCSRSQG